MVDGFKYSSIWLYVGEIEGIELCGVRVSECVQLCVDCVLYMFNCNFEKCISIRKCISLSTSPS